MALLAPSAVRLRSGTKFVSNLGNGGVSAKHLRPSGSVAAVERDIWGQTRRPWQREHLRAGLRHRFLWSRSHAPLPCCSAWGHPVVRAEPVVEFGEIGSSLGIKIAEGGRQSVGARVVDPSDRPKKPDIHKQSRPPIQNQTDRCNQAGAIYIQHEARRPPTGRNPRTENAAGEAASPVSLTRRS